jgi:hypothetical protein
MGKNTKKKPGSKKSHKSAEKARKEALAVTSANIARIEAAENGLAAPTTDGTSDAVPVDQLTKPSKPKKDEKSKAEKPAKAPKEKPARQPSLLDHAVEILKKAKEPMTCKEITEAVMKSTDWTTNGKTPWATLYSAVIREIAEKKAESRFKKMDRGMFSFNG